MDTSEEKPAGSPVAEYIDGSIDDTLAGKAEAEPPEATEDNHMQQFRKLTDDEKRKLAEIQALTVCIPVLTDDCINFTLISNSLFMAALAYRTTQQPSFLPAH